MGRSEGMEREGMEGGNEGREMYLVRRIGGRVFWQRDVWKKGGLG